MSRGRESKNPVSGKRIRGKQIAVLFCVFFFWILLGTAFVWSFGSYKETKFYDPMQPVLSRVTDWLIHPAWSSASPKLIGYTVRWFPLIAGISALLTLLFELSLMGSGNYKSVEHGSAHWATKKDLKPFRKKKNHMPLADGVYQTEAAKLPNNNVAITSGPGSGKTFNLILPAIEAVTNPKYEQGSFIVTDTKGSVYRTTAKMVRERGIEIYVYNLADPEYSNCYNPLELVHKDNAETEINQLALVYSKNVRDEEASVGDDIWEKTFKALLVAVWMYQYRYNVNPVNHRSETRALWRTAELIRGIHLTEGKIADCELANIIDRIRQTSPLSPIVANYDFVNAGAGETIASVVFTAGSKMEFLSYGVIECLTRKNELPLDELADRPMALYINYNVGSPYRALAALCIEQAFMCLYRIAEIKFNNVLPRRVRFLLDELPNICRVYTLPERLSTCREYNIDVVLIMQAMEQLERSYQKAHNTLLNNCAVQGLFGSSEPETLKRFSEAMGKTTTTEKDSSYNRGSKQGGGSDSEKGIGRELALPSELFTLDSRYCVLLVQGHPPIFANKFRTVDQKWYKELGGRGNPENSRSIEADLTVLRGIHLAEYELERRMREERHRMDAEFVG